MSAVDLQVSFPAAPFPSQVEAEDQRRLARARQGESAAFEEIVRQHQPRLYRLAYRMLRHREEAEDVAQEALLKAFESLPSLRHSGALRAWLDRITVTLCLSRLRSASHRREFASECLLFRPAEGPAQDDVEFSRLVREVVSQLPPRYRSLIQACYLEGRSYHEVAGLAGIELSAVKTRLFRARRCLRARLAEALGDAVPAAH